MNSREFANLGDGLRKGSVVTFRDFINDLAIALKNGLIELWTIKLEFYSIRVV